MVPAVVDDCSRAFYRGIVTENAQAVLGRFFWYRLAVAGMDIIERYSQPAYFIGKNG